MTEHQRRNGFASQLMSPQNLFNVSINGCSAREKPTKKRSIDALCEHFEAVFCAAMRRSVRLWTSSRCTRTASSLCLAGIILGVQGCALLPPQQQPAPQPPAAQKKENIVAPRIECPTPSAPAPTTEPRLKAGECWVPAVVLPRRVSMPLEIVTRDAVNDIQVQPAVIQPEQRSRVVREGVRTYRVEPPVFKQVTEKVLVREEVRRSIVEPATFETREEKIEIEAAHEVLQPCRIHSGSNAKGLCVKSVPARYKTLTRKILLKPETLREEIEPAVYREVKKWVVETPARTVPVDIPEKTGAITVQSVSTQEQINEQQRPPIVANLESINYEGEPMPTWRQAPCADDITPELIKQLQIALNDAGQDAGRADGKLGDRTLRALQNYQREHGLASGALTLETLHHLGVLDQGVMDSAR